MRRRLFEFNIFVRRCHGLFQRGDLKVLHRVFAERRFIARVFGRHRGARRVGQVNARTCAGHFLEALRQLPGFGASDGPVGGRIDIVGRCR